MKRFITLLLAAALIFSLAACGDSGSDKKSENVEEKSTAEATQAVEETEAATEEATQEATEVDDDTLIKETMAKLVGDWTYTGMEDFVTLTFNEDGTGSYKGIDDADLTFTYTLTMEHKEYNNGEPYIDKTLKMNYSTGESEEIVIRFLEEATETMTFSTADGGGYTGVIGYYGGWIRA